MLLCVTLSWGINFPIWLSANISAIFMALCGAWLGFAWSKPRFGALVIRIVLISLLIIGGVSVETLLCCSSEAMKAHDYGHLFLVTVLAVATSWGSGFSIGSTTREMTRMLYISAEASDEQRWPYRLWTEFLRDFLHNPGQKIRYWLDLDAGLEDKATATAVDLFMVKWGAQALITIVCIVIGGILLHVVLKIAQLS